MTHENTHDDWWSTLERDVLECLTAARATTPGEIAERLRMSEAAAVSLIGALAMEGKVRIALVESIAVI